MKEPKKNIFSRFLFSGLFENIYYFLVMHVWLVVGIIGTGISVMAILLVLEFLFPKDVHLLNYALTNKTFKELVENHHYHAAIFVAESDTSYINDRLETITNRDMLRECYTHVGEYSKAEKISRDFMAIDDDMAQSADEKIGLTMLKTIAARDLFRLYEKMGDRGKQLEMYKMLVEYYNNPQVRNIEEFAKSKGVNIPIIDEEHSDAFSVNHNLKYDIICGMYLTDPQSAIDSLNSYLTGVWQLPKFNASLKLTMVNRLISWHLEQGELFRAQMMLLNGLEIAKHIDREEGVGPLGEFAEYCYILHDKNNARRYMRIYMRYIDKYYNDNDLEYLMAEMRYIKYSEDDPQKIIDKLSHCCMGIREQISKNFAGMTASQQEYFAQKLEEPFSYALQLLAKNPSNKDLIELCFENEVFRRGLLLRSDVLLRRALEESQDKTLLTEYDKYIDYKRELIAREDISGPGNLTRKIYLKRQISSIEEKLADGCAEFSRGNYADADMSQIKSALKRNGNKTLVTYVEIPTESGTSLGAFVLNGKHGLQYCDLCSANDVEQFNNTTEPVYRLCKNKDLYRILFSKMERFLESGADVVYSPAGIVHRIPMAALYTDDRSTIGDKYGMTIIANPIDLAYGRNEKKSQFDVTGKQVALWGGIKYGVSESGNDLIVSQLRSMVRGKRLTYLEGSLREVNEIETILRNGGVQGIHKYTDTAATESTFKTESGKFNIIHISTHGFFNEDKSHEFSNVMHNSGLFFAKANRAWMDEYTPDKYWKEYEDGILRAEEIETQNLASCELVVLSACETGLGEIKGDEGVFGLQRAFKLAGAKCIIMSLWPVPDNATKELMNRFYANLINTNDIDKAFSDAQKSMRNTYDVQAWGGFVILH